MSLWRRLTGRLGKGSQADEGSSSTAAEGGASESARGIDDAPPARRGEHRGAGPETGSAELAARASLLDATPSRSALLSARGTRDEARVVAALLEARATLDEPTTIALAEVLAARGDEASALEVLEGTGSARALLLRADLQAARGRLADALGSIERVLAKDLATPGALERHQRWSSSLGVALAARAVVADATAALPTSSDSPFVIRRELARGGGGAVYEAEDPVLLRRVALKIHHGAARARRAAKHEVDLAVELRGAGVVRVLDACPDEGWVALEWAPLGSLRDLLRDGRVAELLPAERWLVPLAEALARVHGRGVVHYDLKPANVLLGRHDDPWLTDFGIARRVGDPGGGGSRGYLSPERLGGREAAPSDDVYAFGRLLEDVVEASGAPRAPAWLRRVATRCLAAETERPPTGAALCELVRDARVVEHPGA